jgi:diacylglycerol kinase
MRPEGGLAAFLAGFVHAGRGLALAAAERNFRVELAVACIVLVAGGLLRVGPGEWALLILCISWVLGMEALNTAVERLADRVSRAHDPLIKQAKDLAAAGVLLSALGAAVIGLIVFIPHLAALLQHHSLTP